MRVLLFQIDGKIPNIVLMRLAAHHSGLGHEVELRRTAEPEQTLWDAAEMPDLVYPMPYVRTQELVGFQRWVIGAYDKRIRWHDWQEASYQPRNLGPAVDSIDTGLTLI